MDADPPEINARSGLEAATCDRTVFSRLPALSFQRTVSYAPLNRTDARVDEFPARAVFPPKAAPLAQACSTEY